MRITQLIFLLLPVGAMHGTTCAEILYASLTNGQIKQFDSSGVALGAFTIDAPARTIAVDQRGSVYTTSLPPSKDINKYARDGRRFGTFATVGTDDSHALGLVIDSKGILYAGVNYCCRGGRDTIERIAPDGTPLGVFATVATGPPGATFELVFDAKGRLYALDHDRIERFDVDGTSLGTFAVLSTTSFIIDLAFDNRGSLYAMTLDDVVYKFDASGNSLGPVLIGSDFDSMAFDKEDVLYVGGAGSIRKFLNDGTYLGVFATNLAGAVVDLKFVEVIPEAGSCMLAALGCPFLFVMLNRISRRPGSALFS